MTAYKKIYEEAIGNFGLFRASEAAGLGISRTAILKLAQRNRLERLGRGVYRICDYVPDSNGLDAYAIAVAVCGDEAYLYGPSVLAMHGICPADPSKIYVATPNRFRGRVPDGIELKANAATRNEIRLVEGIRAQAVDDAILDSLHTIMLPRLLDAVDKAVDKGLLDKVQAEKTIKELYRND